MGLLEGRRPKEAGTPPLMLPASLCNRARREGPAGPRKRELDTLIHKIWSYAQSMWGF